MARRFGFGHAARGLSRDRAVVALADVGGSAVTGTIDAVGADALELSEHASDLPRRPENVPPGGWCRSPRSRRCGRPDPSAGRGEGCAAAESYSPTWPKGWASTNVLVSEYIRWM